MAEPYGEFKIRSQEPGAQRAANPAHNFPHGALAEARGTLGDSDADEPPPPTQRGALAEVHRNRHLAPKDWLIDRCIDRLCELIAWLSVLEAVRASQV